MMFQGEEIKETRACGYYSEDNLIAELIYKGVKYWIAADTMEHIELEINKIKISDAIPEDVKIIISTSEELEIREWMETYEKMPASDQWIIETVFPELKDTDIKKRKSVSRIHRIAVNKIIKSGFKTVCSRCNGTGHYSSCQKYGTICFKCEGSKVQLPKLTKAVKLEIQKHFESK